MNPVGDIYTGAANGLREVWSNKVRSLLSMSGIILGVAALVAMVGIVQGMLGNMRASFERSGGVLKLEVHPQEAPEWQQHIAGISPGMTWRDIGAIDKAIPLVAYVSPVVDMNWERFIANGQRRGALLQGVTPDYSGIKLNEIQHGRFISDYDVASKSPVIVVGAYIADALFPGQSRVIGEQVRVSGQVYTIVGQIQPIESVTSPAGRSSRFNREERYNYIPATTAMARYKGDDEVNRIEILAHDVGDMPDLIEQIENTLTQTHRGISDFEIRTQDEQLAELKKLENSFTYSLGGIAGISLLVGGIGIMNVMLASVSERIREIGVRKAIGARSHDIFIQFLAEAVVISVLGGLLGLVASVGLLSLARDFIPEGENISVMPVTAMFYGFLFSSLIGLASGVYPAMRASRLDPIDALRYE
ncbi:ABC transporter permease [Coraliomargarita sp. SDUM461004]|uniref:ABC transporter permease n=1 Tax=Thalassobacterium sedimentorum TaxID=3041258 RepID=A0ABU1AI49_9BACT|nr:ABC transporter permease [Coraliomargarita sp. SDUM461004]MDQ8193461.1 ABC transporter permease [Coraliomargarita sp. SDUM461004]